MNVIVILCDTLRRDHCGPYHGGRPLNQCWSDEAPDWVVPTPNMDRLAERGVVFDNCWCGSTPCMPARRDIYTGRYEFLRRGWGPLEDDDRDLPREVSGPPNQSVQWTLENGYKVSYLISDHFHLWEQGSGNYHMGYTGFDFVRGIEADAWYTAPVEFDCPPETRLRKNERHWRNVHFCRKTESDDFSAQVCQRAAAWLERNHTHQDFYLHLDIFSPHEPWDPPERVLKMFDPKGYDVDCPRTTAPYQPWRKALTEEQFHHFRARYAAKVAFLDEQLGEIFDTMDQLDLWKDTLVMLTTDHGTYNGDHGRMGKLQTHEHDAVGHIPFFVAHPEIHGERRSQLVQLVDVYPTVLAATGRPIPENIHGKNLLPAMADAAAPTRDVALCGQFGKSVTITDGRWILHQSPVETNQPLYWYGHPLARFLKCELGDYVDGRRPVTDYQSWFAPTWLSDKDEDPNERVNLADRNPDKLREMQQLLKRTLLELDAPAEQFERLGLRAV